MMAGFGLKLLSEQDILLMCWAGLVPRREEGRLRRWRRESERNRKGRGKSVWKCGDKVYRLWRGRRKRMCGWDVRCQCFDLSGCLQDSVLLFRPPPQHPFLPLCLWATTAQLHPQRTWLFISLIGHICRLPWGCLSWRSKMGEEGARLGSWGPNTGCKALAKSNMALFVFAGQSPSVCFRPGCPPGLAVCWAWK